MVYCRSKDLLTEILVPGILTTKMIIRSPLKNVSQQMGDDDYSCYVGARSSNDHTLVRNNVETDVYRVRVISYKSELNNE